MTIFRLQKDEKRCIRVLSEDGTDLFEIGFSQNTIVVGSPSRLDAKTEFTAGPLGNDMVFIRRKSK